MKPFSILEPQNQRNGLVFNSPHSGTYVPGDFAASLAVDLKKLSYSSDSFVNILLENIPRSGAHVFLNHYLRSYLDTNRADDELDSSMFNDGNEAFFKPTNLNLAHPMSNKVAKGFGLLARKTFDHQEIYKETLPLSEIERRLNTIYYPVHQALKALLDHTKQQQNYYLLIDCHSMPSLNFINPGFKNFSQPDIILGNCFNASCNQKISDFFARFFMDHGLNVLFNTPYAGGYNTRHYSAPDQKQYCIQIEINRALYMDEENITPHNGLVRIKNMMNELATHLDEEIKRLI